MGKMKSDLKKHVTLYQSDFFRKNFPKDNFHFENIIITKKREDRDSSLKLMRSEMLFKNDYSAGIFIGGMEGVINEYLLFKQAHPKALILPVASTGAAAKIIYEKHEKPSNQRLLNDYAYMGLFSSEKCYPNV